MRNDFMTWHRMAVCKIRGRRSSCSGLERSGEAIRDYLLLASGYGTWDRIVWISMVRGGIAGG